TTTQSSQPIAAQIPSILRQVITVTTTPDATPGSSTPDPSLLPSSTAGSSQGTTETTHIRYEIATPLLLPPNASRADLYNQNKELMTLLGNASIQLQKNYAQLVLMDQENGRLRQKIFEKKNKKKTIVDPRTSKNAWHMTSDTILKDLA